MRELSNNHEDHVSKLEAKLSELSAAVANYDRSHQSNIDTIQSLKVM